MLDLKAFGSVEGTMFIAMNHFKVRPEKEAEFKNCWLEREVLLNTASGFLMIQFMRGNVFPGYVAYASQTVWTSREAYEAWRKSELFHAAHKGVGQGEALTLEKRAFSSYEVLRTVIGQEQAA
ncbi:antibiotic biosynthesis monooxygenase family protein [Acetobacter pasteurianus]|uniref:antibiotic biosynthesis monooxygenase family protein n=1 Tax=Acetobacter pasteurianus TaxID=438 RepID=UPI00286D0A60|nr:antibiotic biosynthesis monooxygenase [Acetobacter pasteurianus]WKC16567.1 antibiotic biosynthesis monooxygenase [Acetobacter pasteurianus]